ncbi:MAG TPA: hypothetical protein VGL38_06960 [bacterium]|jgi:hypothetical protein
MKVNREIVRLQLAHWCAAPGEGKSYFRPLVCRGDVEQVDIFLVETHPPTPIPPPVTYAGLDPARARELHELFLERYPLADYVGKLTDYAAFTEMCCDVRRSLGKDLMSPTRQRLEQFIAANPRADHAVAEVFLNAYPVKDAAALKSEDRRVVEKGYDLFFELLHLFRPAWVLLMGKPAFDEGAKYFNARFGVPDFKKRWKDVEVREPVPVPLATLKLHGVKCHVLGCRSFDKRPVHGLPDSEYSDARFETFCRSAWQMMSAP